MALSFTSGHGLDITFHYGVLRGAVRFHRRRRHGGAVPRRSKDRAHPGLDAFAMQTSAAFAAGLCRHLHRLVAHPATTSHRPAADGAGLRAGLRRGRAGAGSEDPLPQMLGEWSYAIYLGQTTWLHASCVSPNSGCIRRRIPSCWACAFSDLIWWLEPLGLVIICVAWGGLLAECHRTPGAAKLRKPFGRRLDPQSIPTPS